MWIYNSKSNNNKNNNNNNNKPQFSGKTVRFLFWKISNYHSLILIL